MLALAASVQLLREPSSVLGALANLCLLGLVGCPARNGAVEGSTFAKTGMPGRVGMGNRNMYAKCHMEKWDADR